MTRDLAAILAQLAILERRARHSARQRLVAGPHRDAGLADLLADELAALLDLVHGATSCVVDGRPQPQQRARGSVRTRRVVRGGRLIAEHFVRMRDPVDSKAWKAAAAWHLHRALAKPRNPLEGPLLVWIRATNAAPARSAAPRAWNTKATGDVDNVAKAVLDAGNAIAWQDDRQVARLVVERVVGGACEPPRVEIAFGPLGPLHAREAAA